jgi:hypothetical protein
MDRGYGIPLAADPRGLSSLKERGRVKGGFAGFWRLGGRA